MAGSLEDHFVTVYSLLTGVSQIHFIDINASANTDESVQTLLTHINTHEFFNIMDKFLSIKKKDKNFAYFLTYMDMVQVLLAFTWAQRSDDFKLHLNTFTRMLGFFLR